MSVDSYKGERKLGSCSALGTISCQGDTTGVVLSGGLPQQDTMSDTHHTPDAHHPETQVLEVLRTSLSQPAVSPPDTCAAEVASAASMPREVFISVDVVCPERFAKDFAVAPFVLRVPAVALGSLVTLFAALKYGALADETEDFEFLQSVGAKDWILPQHGVIFAQERPLGHEGRARWTALSSAADLAQSEPIVVCGVREWRKLKSIEAKEEKDEIFHKRRLEEARWFSPERQNGESPLSLSSPRKVAKTGSGLSPASGLPMTNGSLRGEPLHDFNDLVPGTPPRASLHGGGILTVPNNDNASREAGTGDMEEEARTSMALRAVHGIPEGTIASTPAASIQYNDGMVGVAGVLDMRSGGGLAPGASPCTLGGDMGLAAAAATSMSSSPSSSAAAAAAAAVVTAVGSMLGEHNLPLVQNRKRMHKVHGPAFCKMFQMLKIRFIPQGSPTTLRDNSHIVVGYAAKGEEFGRLSNKAATVKVKNVNWNDPGFMELIASAGGSALAGCKLPERAERIFASMTSTEAMRAALMWRCAEACSRLCTFGKVYKEKKGMPFDSLAKAFSEEFRLPPDTFPATEAAALQALRLGSPHGPPPSPAPPPQARPTPLLSPPHLSLELPPGHSAFCS